MNTGSKHKIPVICLFGPTAVGKTGSLHLFSDKCEIISADSMQVYRHMDIGTAKPGRDVLDSMPHHLIDIINPDEQFNAGLFVEKADDLCRQIYAKDKIPLITGGTGFYFINFINGLPQTPKSVPEIKRKLIAEYNKEGPEQMWRLLEKSDPVTAARLPVNDRQRVIRALEVYRISGKPLSSFKPGSGRHEMYEFLVIGLKQDRDKLYDSINRRVGAMFAAGLTGEIQKLKKMGYSFSDPGMKGIGYSEFAAYADNPDSAELALLKEEIAKNTRRYAKRQITFFSKIKETMWIDAEDMGQLALAATRFINDFSV